MNKIIRYWNQNRVQIIIITLAVAFVIIMIQILNQAAKRENENKLNQVTEEKQEDLPTESIIGGKPISNEKTKENVSEIEEFLNNCNNGNIEEAYNLLTKDCKEVLYKTQEEFEKLYYNKFFKETRTWDIELFTSISKRYTYKVSLSSDVMSTGNIRNSQTYQDYITIDENSLEGKVNVSSFIKKEEINKEVEKDGIKILVISKEIYKENEKYQVKIENNTDKRISINTNKKSKTIYLMGDDNISYNAYTSEISSVLYEIPANFYRNYTFKFNKIYTNDVTTKGIVFSDIVPDYEEYKQQDNGERIRISIAI